MGFIGAVVFHSTILFGFRAGLFQKIQYGVSQGESSVEVNLVSSATQPEVVESSPQAVETLNAQEIGKNEVSDELVIPIKSESVSDQTPQSKPHEHQKTPLKVSPSAVAFANDGGAQAKPFYLKNTPPMYPEISRRRGEEGVVILNVQVDERGEVVSVVIKDGSGFNRLDQSAVKAVERWKFNPARVGMIPVASQVEIPIRFQLNVNDN